MQSPACRSKRLVADLEPGVALEEEVGLLAADARGAGRAGVAGLQLPDRELEGALQRGGEELEAGTRRPRDDDRAPGSAAHDADDGALLRRAGETARCRARRRCCAACPATGRAGRARPGSASTPRRRRWRTAAPASGRARDGDGGWPAELPALDLAEVGSRAHFSLTKTDASIGAMRDPLAARLGGPRHRCGRRPRRRARGGAARARRPRSWRSTASRSTPRRRRPRLHASTSSTRPPSRRRWPTPRRPACDCATWWRSPAARCRTRRPASIRPRCRSTCSARSLEQNLPRPGSRPRRAAAPARRRGRPLDHAHLVHRRARRVRPAGVRGREGGPARPGAIAGRHARRRRDPHQRGRARRRADAAQRARVGARARLVRPAAARRRCSTGSATPEDIAATYLALIDLQHVTGQTIVVDGGQTIAAAATPAPEPSPPEEPG